AIALPQAGDEQGFQRLEARRLEIRQEALVHDEGLHEFEVVETTPRAQLLGRQPELFAECAGECLVRGVTGCQSDSEYIGRSLGQRSRCLAEAAPADVAKGRLARRHAEGPRHMVARDAAYGRDLVQRDLLGEVA